MYLQCNHLRTVPYYDTLLQLSDVPSKNHWNMRGCTPEFLNNKNLLRTWDPNQNSNGWCFFSWHLLHSYLLCGCLCMVGWLLLVVSCVFLFLFLFLLLISCCGRHVHSDSMLVVVLIFPCRFSFLLLLFVVVVILVLVWSLNPVCTHTASNTDMRIKSANAHLSKTNNTCMTGHNVNNKKNTGTAAMMSTNVWVSHENN